MRAAPMISANSMPQKMTIRPQQITVGVSTAAAALPVLVSCVCARPMTATIRPQMAPMMPPQNGMIAIG